MQCPDCDKFIRPDAFKCSCGWTRTNFEQAKIIDCAYHGCMSPAILSLKKKTGWANMCLHHYQNDNLAEAEEFCAKNGLDTTEKKIAFCLAMFKKPRDPRAWMKNPKTEAARRMRDEVLAKKTIPNRQPGEDHEEDAAEATA